METGRVNGEERIGSVVGVLTVEGTSGDPGLLFADKFVEVLKEADQDDEERAGNSHKEDIQVSTVITAWARAITRAL